MKIYPESCGECGGAVQYPERVRVIEIEVDGKPGYLGVHERCWPATEKMLREMELDIPPFETRII